MTGDGSLWLFVANLFPESASFIEIAEVGADRAQVIEGRGVRRIHVEKSSRGGFSLCPIFQFCIRAGQVQPRLFVCPGKLSSPQAVQFLIPSSAAWGEDSLPGEMICAFMFWLISAVKATIVMPVRARMVRCCSGLGVLSARNSARKTR